MTDILKKRALEVSDALWDIAKENPSVERQLRECAKVLSLAASVAQKRIYFIDENRGCGHSYHIVRATSEKEAFDLCGLTYVGSVVRSFEEIEGTPFHPGPTLAVQLTQEGDSTVLWSDEDSPDSVRD